MSKTNGARLNSEYGERICAISSRREIHAGQLEQDRTRKVVVKVYKMKLGKRRQERQTEHFRKVIRNLECAWLSAKMVSARNNWIRINQWTGCWSVHCWIESTDANRTPETRKNSERGSREYVNEISMERLVQRQKLSRNSEKGLVVCYWVQSRNTSAKYEARRNREKIDGLCFLGWRWGGTMRALNHNRRKNAVTQYAIVSLR